jgi:coenzyme F420 hydrogenase subunit beta
MYRGAVRAFLAAHGVSAGVAIRAIEWRAGEWPGHLRVETEDGRIFQAHKFHYNYLTPFFIACSCLITPDFTNELADLSVGDAWSPGLEDRGGGHSVVITRSDASDELLRSMQAAGLVELEEILLERAVAMHAHMLDFKKRGCFLRLGRIAPAYGYRPEYIPASRRAVETVIRFFLWVGRRRCLLSLMPLGVAGPLFALIRRGWKRLSKPVKRKGLLTVRFVEEPDPDRWREILEAIEPR